MEVTFLIEYVQDVVLQDIPRLSKADASRIRRAIEQKLARNPVEFGKPLRYSLRGARSLRVGDHRVIFVIEGHRVVVTKIGHRREVYEGI